MPIEQIPYRQPKARMTRDEIRDLLVDIAGDWHGEDFVYYCGFSPVHSAKIVEQIKDLREERPS